MCHCYGFIVLNKEKTECLLVKANKWGFPKGKREKNETIQQCSFRELNEETSLTENDIIVDPDIPMQVELSNKGKKSVGLFVGYTNKKEVKIQDQNELNDIGWFSIDNALNLLKGVKNRKELLENVIKKYFLNDKNA
jgi:8-oxo-(d)GTP phosphatase